MSHRPRTSSAPLRFEYCPYDGNWLPIVPIVFRHEKKELPTVRALVDTGATHTVLPMEMATQLGIAVDVTSPMESHVAGGGQCHVYPSPVKIDYLLQENETGRKHQWKGQLFFALGQRFVLLGHHQCLENFDVMFRGRKRVLELATCEQRKSRR